MFMINRAEPVNTSSIPPRGQKLRWQLPQDASDLGNMANMMNKAQYLSYLHGVYNIAQAVVVGLCITHIILITGFQPRLAVFPGTLIAMTPDMLHLILVSLVVAALLSMSSTILSGHRLKLLSTFPSSLSITCQFMVAVDDSHVYHQLLALYSNVMLRGLERAIIVFNQLCSTFILVFLLRPFMLAVIMWPFFTLLFNARKKASVDEDLSNLIIWSFQRIFRRAPSNERLVENIHDTLSLPDSEFFLLLKKYLASRALRKAVQTSGPSTSSHIYRPPHLKRKENLAMFSSGRSGKPSIAAAAFSVKTGVSRMGGNRVSAANMRISGTGQALSPVKGFSGRVSFPSGVVSPKGPVAESHENEREEIQPTSRSNSHSSPRIEVTGDEQPCVSPSLDARITQSLEEANQANGSLSNSYKEVSSPGKSSANQSGRAKKDEDLDLEASRYKTLATTMMRLSHFRTYMPTLSMMDVSLAPLTATEPARGTEGKEEDKEEAVNRENVSLCLLSRFLAYFCSYFLSLIMSLLNLSGGERCQSFGEPSNEAP